MPHLLSLPRFLASHAVEIKNAIMCSQNIEILTCLQKNIIVAPEEDLISLVGFLSSLPYASIVTNTTSMQAYMAVITTIKARSMILSCSPDSCHKDVLLVLEKLTL